MAESLKAIQNEYDGENVESHDRGLILLLNSRCSRYPDNAIAMREALKEYLNNPVGSVEWQLDYVWCLEKIKYNFVKKQNHFY